MPSLSCALLRDGTSDDALLPIIDWIITRATTVEYEVNVVKLISSKFGLVKRIKLASDLYQPHLLFVHRDSEAKTSAPRYTEIAAAVAANGGLPYVAIVPVRMTEAWLLSEEAPIRHAVGNPNGKQKLNLPNLRRIESRRDPKRDLFNALKVASGLSGSRLKALRPEEFRHRVAQLTDDFSKLRNLPSFKRFEDDLVAWLGANNFAIS